MLFGTYKFTMFIIVLFFTPTYLMIFGDNETRVETVKFVVGALAAIGVFAGVVWTITMIIKS